ncbi:unnamed protein product [Amoebophrya sp. A25]|nr:unnamed protein product [Amoebophrya sp. A25]|eukprot:GSA25T00025842001.1
MQSSSSVSVIQGGTNANSYRRACYRTTTRQSMPPRFRSPRRQAQDAPHRLDNKEFTFGKHAGKTFLQVFRTQPGYATWAEKQENLSGPLKKFVKYCKAKKKAAGGGNGGGSGSSSRTESEEVKKFIREQTELLGGGKALYDLIHKNLKELKSNPFFIEEQCALFEWRRKFFDEHFEDGAWHTDGADDSHDLDTIPYNCAQNFDYVMKCAAGIDDSDSDFSDDEEDDEFSDVSEGRGCPHYFPNDECASATANKLYDRDGFTMQENEDVTLSQEIHMIIAINGGRLRENSTYQKEFTQIRAAFLDPAKKSSLPVNLKKKMETGLFTDRSEILAHLDGGTFTFGEDERGLLETIRDSLDQKFVGDE